MILRPLLLFWLEIYHELNRVNFHSLNDAVETLIRMTKHSPTKQNWTNQFRSPSYKKSQVDQNSGAIRLIVLERVRVMDSQQGPINFYKVEVIWHNKKVSTIEKTYQEFRTF